MSVGPTQASGLPVVNQALEPAWVRHGSPSTQKAYQSALSFEQTLVEQLSKSLAATSGLGGEESSGEGESSEEGGASSGELSSMLPQALSSSVMSAGGLGLAAELTRGLESAESAQTGASATTGTTASTQVGTSGGAPS
jgi:Rod binding domain-containing protein